MLQDALNGDRRVVLRLRQHQILMGNDGRIAGLELVILLLTADGGIIRLISGHDASTMRVAVVIQPRQAAVLARNGLAEGVQVAGNVLGIGIAIADTVKVMRLDLGHKRELVVDLLLR